MPNWKKVIVSGSDAILSDVTIDDWGSVSSSLASLEASSTPTLQDVTDNGNTTTNNITVSSITSSNDILVGSISFGRGPSSGNNNIVAGFGAMESATTAHTNISIGDNALSSLEVSTNNLALGHYSLNTATGSDNTAVGQYSQRFSTGSFNTSVGTFALWYAGGSSNSAVGYQALHINSGGNFNSALGTQALHYVGQSNSPSHRNVGVGAYTLERSSNSVDTIAIGYEAGKYRGPNNNNYNLSPSASIFIGSDTRSTGNSAQSTNEIVIGYGVIGNGTNTVTIGNSDITYNYFSGNISGSDVTIDDWGSVSSSLASLEASSTPTLQDVTDNGNTTTNDITVAGDVQIHKGPNEKIFAIAIGSGSLQNDESFAGNIAIGVNALHSNTTGTGNIAIGTRTLSGSLTGNANVAIGDMALFRNTTGTENTAIGDSAMYNNSTGDDNTALGIHSLGINSGDGNVALGYNAHRSGVNSNYNTSVGFSALYGGGYTGGHSVAIGAYAAGDIPNNVGWTKPTDGVYIGAYTIGSAEHTTNEIVIGAYVTGSGNNTVTIGNSSITNNYFSGDIDADDITIDGWGSISASLASIESTGSSQNLQQVTDNGATTTNSITITGSIYLNSDGGADVTVSGRGVDVFATGSALNAGFLVSGSGDGLNASEGDILIAGHSTIYTPWSDKGSYNKFVNASGGNSDSLLQMDTRYYIGAIVHYTAYSSDYSNIRTGTISLAFNSTTFTLNETSTTDIGDTDSLTFDAYFIGTPASLYLEANFSNDWNISLDYTFLRKAEFKNGILNYTVQNQ